MTEPLSSERQLQALCEITQAIGASLSQQEVLNAILERTVTAFGYKAAILRLLDAERLRLELKAAFGLSQAYLTKGPIELAHSGIDRQVLQGQTVVVRSIGQDLDYPYPDAAVREGLSSLLCVPLRSRERIIGVLRVYTADVHDFSAAEQELVSVVANLGAQAIERTRLFEAFRRIAQQVNSTLQLTQVLTTLLVESVSEVNVKGGSIRLLGPQRATLHLAAACGLSDAYLQKGAVQVAQSPVDQRVLEAAQPVSIADLMAEHVFQYPVEAEREGIHAVLVLPLRVRETVIGVMRLYSGQVRQFSPEEIEFAATVADLGAIAIENAKLHQAVKERLETLKEDSDGWYRFLTMS